MVYGILLKLNKIQNTKKLILVGNAIRKCNFFSLLKIESVNKFVFFNVGHKVLIQFIKYIEHHSVCPLVGIGTPPTPLPQRVCPPPRTKRWGGTLACGLGVGGVPIPTTGEKP
jgi:hypothetical protein